jgi:hypothetical protein
VGNFFRKKVLTELSSNGALNKGEDSGLKRVLTVKDLTLMGVAAVVGVVYSQLLALLRLMADLE